MQCGVDFLTHAGKNIAHMFFPCLKQHLFQSSALN
jgi:hypothetical protein